MKINVSDGFVELVDHMGEDDLAIVNAARVSYAGASNEWTDRDEKAFAISLGSQSIQVPLDMATSSLGLKHQYSF